MLPLISNGEREREREREREKQQAAADDDDDRTHTAVEDEDDRLTEVYLSWSIDRSKVGCVLIFCLEWLVQTLAFFLKYYAYVEDGDLSKRSAKVRQVEENMKYWPWPFQVWT
ncbi:hypothetical protein RHSIM_Rhsim04G0100700 [Rhododendron simsii]|uniref:Uncharacterized protein n=1 Tax=Rhododendron simsii TaxID=118357 RepID=A0A834HDU2_RHOSS|nr:hypothetical protein RHSIM_Rhsim04G0100700 [Rhododendron simsii]